MENKKGIRKKLTRLIMIIAIVAVAIVVICSTGSMSIMSGKSLEIASNYAVERLNELTENKAVTADSMLLLAQNQTLMVADGAKELLSNSDRYLRGYSEEALPELACANPDMIGKYSMHARVPEKYLKDVKTEVINGEDTVTYATINTAAPIDGKFSVKQELYLGSLLSNELDQIERFRNEDGSYTGFTATYFCFDDSGIDVLGDLETQNMIKYDARERGWYTGAVDAYKNNTLTKYGVFWTDPVPDGSGRGIAVICSAPVVIDGKVVGVAGSGGLLTNFSELLKNTQIGKTGYSFMVSRSTSKIILNPKASKEDAVETELKIDSLLSESENETLKTLAAEIKDNKFGTVQNVVIDGQDAILSYAALDNNDWSMVSVLPSDDELITKAYNALNRILRLAFLAFFAIIILVVIFVLGVSRRFSQNFTKPIIRLKEEVYEIGHGNLDKKVSIKTGDEIEELGNAFNDMADNLDNYITNLAKVTAEKERIGAELDVATHIQASMLPSIFPAFPEREEFDIFASMNPAKEVGGDFYDFFMVDETHIAIVVADVSGKGVPAALFMVIGKTLIKDHTQPETDLGDVFTEVNNILCDSNSGELFITAFEGVLDLVTGEFTFVNAGHEMPCISKAGGEFVPYKIKPGFVLAGMEDIPYKGGSIILEPGDKIFQYTDGVTEATNANNELFGMDRTVESLNKCRNGKPDEIIPFMKNSIDEFVGDAPQFDDITMLCLEFKMKMKP